MEVEDLFLVEREKKKKFLRRLNKIVFWVWCIYYVIGVICINIGEFWDVRF